VEKFGAQKDFAPRVGLKGSGFSLWVNGWVPDQWGKLRRLCAEAGVSADEILGLPRPALATPPVDPDAPIEQAWIPLVADVAAGEPMLAPREEAEDWYSFKARWV